MKLTFYTVVGYGTLIIDVYLLLASIAVRNMSAAYGRYLIPLVDDPGQVGTLPILLLVTWTAMLAVGCLHFQIDPTDRLNRPLPAGVLWFLFVIAIAWVFMMFSMLGSALQWLWKSLIDATI